MRFCRAAPILVLAFALCIGTTIAAGGESAGNVSNARVLNEGPLGENWFLNGGDFSGSHYSTLKQIDKGNVSSLGLAWSTVIPALDGIAGTPIVVDGVIYFSAAFSIVYAVDAASGEILCRRARGLVLE